MSWLFFALICVFGWGLADLFYKKGTDPETDEAIAKNSAVNAFLKQGLDEKPTYDETIARLKQAVS